MSRVHTRAIRVDFFVLAESVDCIDRSAVNSFNLCRAGTSIVRSIRPYFVHWIPNRGEELSEYGWGLFRDIGPNNEFSTKN